MRNRKNDSRKVYISWQKGDRNSILWKLYSHIDESTKYFNSWVEALTYSRDNFPNTTTYIHNSKKKFAASFFLRDKSEVHIKLKNDKELSKDAYLVISEMFNNAVVEEKTRKKHPKPAWFKWIASLFLCSIILSLTSLSIAYIYWIN